MSRSPVTYAIESEVASQEIWLSLDAEFSTHADTLPGSSSTYLDTFDWRLHRHGGALYLLDRDHPTLSWQTSAGDILRRPLAEQAPEFAEDLPRGTLRESLAPLLEMRRLLPIVRVESKGRLLAILNADDKTVARVVIEEGRAMDPAVDESPRPMPRVLRVVPVRGYDGAFDRVVRYVETTLGLPRLEYGDLTAALETIGRSPGDYSSKLAIQLDPLMPSAEAMKLVHRTLLDAILANEDGTRGDLDSEFLHDFRVAGRRTRAALRQVKSVFPDDAVERFSAELAWLGAVTGPTRDMDVYLLKMPEYRSALPATALEHLDPLNEFLIERQHREHEILVQALDSDRYRALINDWKAFADEPNPEPGPHNAQRAVFLVASERIWRAYRRVLKRGRAIDDSTPAEALHRLRLDCKKLRYLLEFFRSLYERPAIDKLIKALKGLQDNLGDFNDLEVQQLKLPEFALQMMTEDSAAPETLMAMGRLVERLEVSQHRERDRFAECFARFEKRKNRKAFRRLFKARPLGA